MKVSILTGSLSRLNGGVSEAARRLAQELERLVPGMVEVLGVRDASYAADEQGWDPLRPSAFVPWLPKSYGYAPGFRAALDASDPDLCHVHGLWTFASLAARRWSLRKAGRPFVITPHGMLDAWALRNSAWKKKLLGCAIERRSLEEAACLHAITPAEVESIRAYGLSNPVCLIPNGVDLPSAQAFPAPWSNGVPAGRKVLLYLGRIHPKKGLVPLIEGWKLLGETESHVLDEWSLAIAGWSQGGHETQLKRMVADAGLEASVYFAGPLFGEGKAAAYSNASAFILPSRSEGLPLVVLEAWAHSLPVLMTDACNLPQGFSSDAAICIAPEPASIAEGIAALARLEPSAMRSIGSKGRLLVESDFTWEKGAAELRRVYEWLAGGENLPTSVLR